MRDNLESSPQEGNQKHSEKMTGCKKGDLESQAAPGFPRNDQLGDSDSVMSKEIGSIDVDTNVINYRTCSWQKVREIEGTLWSN